MRVIFGGGGTGGHLTPGLSVAEEIRRRFHDADILFLGTGKDLEAHMVCSNGFRLERTSASQLQSGARHLPQFAANLCIGLGEALRLIGRFKPDLVVGLGGYASAAPVIAARLRGLPVLLLEQNSIPGRANRLLARWADEVDCQWKYSADYFPQPTKVAVTGNPIRQRVLTQAAASQDGEGDKRDEMLKLFGLSWGKKTLLVAGGSQGARAINEAVIASLPQFERLADSLQIVHCTGLLDFDLVKAAYAISPLQAHVCSFLDDMGSAYAVADLAVCRAGATTIAELTAVGVPAILIPYPFAADNHQHWNACILADKGAAVLLPQSEGMAEKFTKLVAEMISDPVWLGEMRKASKRLGVPDAAHRVVDRIERLVTNSKPHDA